MVKKVQSLTGKLAALTCFLSKAAERQLPFFKTLKGCLKQKSFVWSSEAETAFQEMKKLLKTLPTLTAPIDGEILYLYMSVANEAFEISGRLSLWAVELGSYQISYLPRSAVKGQIMADYLAEMSGELEVINERPALKPVLGETWDLFTDGASYAEGAGAGLVLANPSGEEHTYALRFNFDVSNNEAEYEALLAGLNIARKMNISKLRAFTDSQLVANQFNGSFEAHDPSMQKYLQLLKELAARFEHFELAQVPRSQNKKADALSKLVALTFSHFQKNREACLVRERAPMYIVQNDILYRKSYCGPMMRCVGPIEAEMIVDEVHNGPFPAGPGNVKFLIVAIDYFTKWVEAKAVRNITAHPQANGLCEVTNRDIVSGIKKRLCEKQTGCVDELPNVLWAHRTTFKKSTGETPFSLVYGSEAVIPAKILVPKHRIVNFEEEANDAALSENLNFIEERSFAKTIEDICTKCEMGFKAYG
ncbi:uncharacterized protein [Rutidosis leptorrhynchoides]|uniref:uncharacterized protein n=1 Tax=Rutidosis leptorrhynchoides TaxID=125765 RepID=UPI003A9A0A76